MFRRVFRLPGGRHLERDVQEELEFHLAMREKSLRELGMSPEDARVEAARQFGNYGAVRSDCVIIDHERERAMSRASLFADLRQDLVYAVRSLRRNLGFTLIAVATLALGIGANTSIFVLIDAVLLRKLPVPNPQELVVVGNPSRVGGVSDGSPRTDLMSYNVYKSLREQNTVFSGLLASGRAPLLSVTENGSGEPEHPSGRLSPATTSACCACPRCSAARSVPTKTATSARRRWR